MEKSTPPLLQPALIMTKGKFYALNPKVRKLSFQKCKCSLQYTFYFFRIWYFFSKWHRKHDEFLRLDSHSICEIELVNLDLWNLWNFLTLTVGLLCQHVHEFFKKKQSFAFLLLFNTHAGLCLLPNIHNED